MLSPTYSSRLRSMSESLKRARQISSAATRRSTMSAVAEKRLCPPEKEAREEQRTSSSSHPFSPPSSPSQPSSSLTSSQSSEDAYKDSSQDTSGTLFRQLFKYYKKRVPPPDLSEVVDCRTRNATPLPADRLPSSSVCHLLGLRPSDQWRLVQFPDRPGLFILPDMLRDEAHLPWISRTLQYANHPDSSTNYALHNDKPFDVSRDGASLRWTTLGVQYDWNTKEYPTSGPSLPTELQQLGKVIAVVLGLGEMRPDAAIVNYYPQKSTLSPHVDRSERAVDVPLVSLSLGRGGIFLCGGPSLDDPILPLWLFSGDVLVMHGSQRLVYHAVPAIQKPEDGEPLPSALSSPPWDLPETPSKPASINPIIRQYAERFRVNITIRQVNP